jgi:regulator of protease activity HflC (stomatin/prohibitin superfamily)
MIYNIIMNSTSTSPRSSPISILLFFVVFIFGLIVSAPLIIANIYVGIVWIVLVLIIARIVSLAVRAASEWERVVILRLGKYSRTKGPGIFFLIPIVETIAYWIDLRTVSTPIRAEQTLTKDNVPVSVEAILFWKVNNPRDAALQVANYKDSADLAAQTALRDMIGKSELATILSDRETIDLSLQDIISKRVTPWGITVISVELRDVIIPENLQNAMSQKAQAERERDARVILGDSEKIIADSFMEAGKKYADNPTAMHLRAMNMLFEGLKEKGALIIVPSSAADTMNLGGIVGLQEYQKQEEKKSNINNTPPNKNSS